MKLMIVDDERVIRESLSTLINWENYDIELIGTCKDGIEAYNMILDESPDIVLTDIKMPGLSGLELVHKISETDLNTQFIILSGFGEFEYAKQAMSDGVKHYLLKPVKEEQLIESIQKIKEDCFQSQAFNQLQADQKYITNSLHTSLIYHIISESISKSDVASIDLSSYEQYLDLTSTSYELCQLEDISQDKISDYVQKLELYQNKHAPAIQTHHIYVNKMLFTFFKSYHNNYTTFDAFMNQTFMNYSYQRESFKNLSLLIEQILEPIRNYGTIYFINNISQVTLCNYKNLIIQFQELTLEIMNAPTDGKSMVLDKMHSLIFGIENIDFSKQLISSMFMQFAKEMSIMTTNELTFLLMDINNCSEVGSLIDMMRTKLDNIISTGLLENDKLSFLNLIKNYVKEHLEDSNLTLKWICENYLYMNVDYVSRKFAKENGCKFSNYLTDLRIQRAKDILRYNPKEKINNVARMIGCGENYSYFVQIFKKHTNLTPTAYAKSTLKP